MPQLRRYERTLSGISLPDALDERLRRYAEAEDEPLAVVIRRALRRFLAEAERIERERAGP